MKQTVRCIVDATLASLKDSGALRFEGAPRYTVEAPQQAGHGDWSCNVALVLARAAGVKPRQLAETLARDLVDPEGVVVRAEAAGPGFLNLWLADRVFQQVAREVLAAGDRYGRQPPRSSGRRVNVEFVSANPTGPVHIGHARGAFVGDGVARLLEAAGHEVTREFYINDFGKQVETLGRTLYKRYRELFGEPAELGEGEYPGAYVIDIARAWRAEVGDRYLAATEAAWLPAATAFAVATNLEAIKTSLARAGIRHDVYASEAALHASGKVREVVDAYRSRGVLYEAAEGRRREQGEKVRSDDSKAAQFGDRQLGGTFLMTATYQEDGRYVLRDDEDRVLLRADGTPVYLTADLAYHKDKLDRGYDLVVNVLGADHFGHVPRIESGVALLGYPVDRLRFLLVQMVRITRAGQEVKLSKRRGTVFELADLIEEAGPDVCRFLFLMKTRDARFDFDLDLVQQQSRDNPVFYFQYGHARCAAILRKAAERGVPFRPDAVSDDALARLTLPEEKAMLKQLSQLPDVVAMAADKLEPHHLLYFCQGLIADFHSYYTQYRADPIIGADAAKTEGRLALVAALKQTLRNAFQILGIDAPEQMAATDTDPP
jgi:arginyl-tRNA synthetase